MGAVVGTVASIRRYPVKSMLGEGLAAVDVVAGHGVLGDRAYAVIDEETGKVVSVKRPKRWGRMFDLAASTAPDDGVVVTFPNGSQAAVDDPGLPGMLSDFFGRAVSVASVPPPGATFDEAWVRHLKNDAEPYFGTPSRIEDANGDHDGDELVDAGQFMSAQGNFFNFGVLHLVTTGTTRRLSELAPESRFDPHRFRPNVVIDTTDEGFVETAWQGQRLAIGDVNVSISFTVPRCVMTTLAHGDLPPDPDVLRTITEHNAVDTFGTGVRYPCVGVYADVADAGRIAVGDPVTLS